MAITASDWTIDNATGNIRYTGAGHPTGSYSTVIDFHRWLQDLADNAVTSAASLDELDITNTNPSARSTDNIITLINGYNIDQQAAEHLFDGSVIQGSGATEEIWDGIVNFGNGDVKIQIIQNGAIVEDDSWNFNTGVGANFDTNAGISHRFMLKTVNGGGNVDGRRILGICRRWGKTYSEFSINGTARGNNVLALSDSDDLNNATASGVVDAMAIANNSYGYVLLDIDKQAPSEPYYSEWTRAGETINSFYEFTKWVTVDSSEFDPAERVAISGLYGLPGELFRGITHQVAITPGAGTWVEPELVTWAGTTVGSGQLFAVDSTTGGSTSLMWMQLLAGQAPSTDLITGANGATGTSATVTSRSISLPFVGASTGSALIGSYGLGMDVDEVSSSDKFTDLSDALVTPPNNVINTVNLLVSGQDYVLVAPRDAVPDINGDPAIKKDQLALASGLTIASPLAVYVADATIPTDTPTTGTIRVTDDNGLDRRLEYSSYANSNIFYISSTDGQEDFSGVNATAANNVYITYIDALCTNGTAPDEPDGSLNWTGVKSAGTRDLVVIVRDGNLASPIKQYIAPWTVGTTNGVVGAIRTTDG